MIIVDTPVWVDYLRETRTPHTDRLEAQLPRELKFAVFETGTVGIAVEAALNYRRLRTAGRTVRKTIDSLIATMIHLKMCSV